jgi:sugar (pentulose or hexulose) kinase
MNGMVGELYDLYRTHAEHTRAGETVTPAFVVATGGGVRKNPMVPDLIEARFGLPVRMPAQQEAAAIGAAVLASRCERDSA